MPAKKPICDYCAHYVNGVCTHVGTCYPLEFTPVGKEELKQHETLGLAKHVDEYRAMVERLQAPLLHLNLPQREDIVLHAILGINDESGELTSIVKRHLVYGEAYSGVHILEELGDLFHYMMYLMIEFNWSLDDIMRANTLKLEKRYPDGFNTEDALKRMDKEGKDKK